MPNNQKHISEKVAVLGMVLAAILWGFSYPLTKYVENCPTYYIIAIRFAIAAVLLAIMFRKSFKNMNKDVIKYAFLLSFAIFAMYAFGVWGIKYTTSVRSSFFTTLSFLMIPIINWIFYKVKISKVIIISAIVCLIGMFLLCYSPDMGSLVINLGDILCTLAALAGSIHIVFVATVSKKETVDPSLFTIFLMAFISVWGFVMALIGGEMAYEAQTSEMVVIVL
ncbi:MAG: DMT family transporter, partial [Firmicutes bacterium]|nr:DMT family transporter [Bacillota bacterium]